MASITASAPGPDPAIGAVGLSDERTGRFEGTMAAPFALAAAASIGAGAIHAAAVGVHAEHKEAAVTFAVLAACQIGWGVAALGTRRRLVGAIGVLINAVALGGWVLAKTRGISFIDGLEEVEGIQWPDFAAAMLALASMLVALRRVVLPGGSSWSEGSGDAPGAPRPPRRGVRSAWTGAIAVVALVGMTTVSGHQHAHAAGHTHTAAGHTHSSGSGHVHAAALPTKEYDPTKPIDLSGVPGVTPGQQARAENLVAINLIRLPHFADYRTAEAEGYHSIRDGFTGFEHFVNWKSINDSDSLDPDHPESLVYSTSGGGRKLVSAMYMLPTGKTLDDVPDVGGALTQWHIHDNLCFGGDPEAPRVSGITNADGTCSPGLTKFTPVPMIHVWITKNPCGPFAALEGVGAGQIKAGEERLCDHVHGSTG
jgi:hypothetical protein